MGPLDANVILRNLPYLWDGLQLSLLLAALAISGGIFFGAIMGVLRMSSIRPVAWLALGYVVDIPPDAQAGANQTFPTSTQGCD